MRVCGVEVGGVLSEARREEAEGSSSWEWKAVALSLDAEVVYWLVLIDDNGALALGRANWREPRTAARARRLL